MATIGDHTFYAGAVAQAAQVLTGAATEVQLNVAPGVEDERPAREAPAFPLARRPHGARFSPGACSTADHIALQWTGGPFELEAVMREQRHSAGYLVINPAGAVPALRDGDDLLTQNAANLGDIADTWPEAGARR